MTRTTRRRALTAKAMNDIVAMAPVVVAQRMTQLSTMPAIRAASKLSEMGMEKNRVFAELLFSSWTTMANAQLNVWTSLFATHGLSFGGHIGSIMTAAGDDIVHRSATTVATRVRRNLAN